MKSKKIILFLLISILLLAGCGEKDEGKEEKVTITYSIWDSKQAVGLEKMAEKFEEENPNIKIDIEVIGWNDYWTMLEAAGTGESLPDTFWMHTNEFHKYASNDMLLDLTDQIKQTEAFDIEKYPEGLVEFYNLDGAQYAVPKDFDTIGLWYNKKMFDEAGLDYPDETWTWDDLYENAKLLTKEEESQYGFVAPLINQEGFYNFIYQNGGTVLNEDNTSGMASPESVEALKYYVRFSDEGISPKIYVDDEARELFLNGQVAMAYFGSWNVSQFVDNEFMIENADVTVLPTGKERASMYNGLGHAISKFTEHPEESWRWVEFLSSEEGQKMHADLGVAISAYEGTAEAWVESTQPFNTQVYIDMIDYGVIRPYTKESAKWEDKNYEILQTAFSGEKSVEDALKEVEETMNELISEEK